MGRTGELLITATALGGNAAWTVPVSAITTTHSPSPHWEPRPGVAGQLAVSGTRRTARPGTTDNKVRGWGTARSRLCDRRAGDQGQEGTKQGVGDDRVSAVDDPCSSQLLAGSTVCGIESPWTQWCVRSTGLSRVISRWHRQGAAVGAMTRARESGPTVAGNNGGGNMGGGVLVKRRSGARAEFQGRVSL